MPSPAVASPTLMERLLGLLPSFRQRHAGMRRRRVHLVTQILGREIADEFPGLLGKDDRILLPSEQNITSGGSVESPLKNE